MRTPHPLFVITVAALCVSISAAARARLEPEALAVGRIRDPAWLPDGRAVRLSSMGQRLLLADLYWLRLVQYVGEMSLVKGDWRALHPLAEVVTDLDPRFAYAYQVAGSDLAGLAHRYDEASRILHKGMANVPDRWTLPWVHAVNKFLYEGDYAEAATYARRAAVVGNRPHLALLAANLSLVTDADDEYLAAKEILAEAIAQADSEDLRGQLEQRLVKVETFERLSIVERAIATFRQRFGRNPVVLSELLAHRLISEVPPDPSGGTFVLAPGTGEVASTVLGRREPLLVTHGSQP